MIIELKTKTRLISNRRNRMLLTLVSPVCVVQPFMCYVLLYGLKLYTARVAVHCMVYTFYYILVVQVQLLYYTSYYTIIISWLFKLYIALVHNTSSLYAGCSSCTQLVYIIPLYYMLVALVVQNSYTSYLFIIRWLFKLYIAGVR